MRIGTVRISDLDSGFSKSKQFGLTLQRLSVRESLLKKAQQSYNLNLQSKKFLVKTLSYELRG